MNNAKVLRSRLLFISLFFLFACGNNSKPPAAAIVDSPASIQAKVTDLIKESLEFADNNKGMLNDSIRLRQPSLLQLAYSKDNAGSIWSSTGKFLPAGDSIFHFIEQAKFYGLFPEDYHYPELSTIRMRIANGATLDAALWCRSDIMMTDALFQFIHDIKLGRLPNDSITLRKDSILSDQFYIDELAAIRSNHSLHQSIQQLEPIHKGYLELKNGLNDFLSHASDKVYTKVPSRLKDPQLYQAALQKRLYEDGFIAFDSTAADSSQLAEAVKLFQKQQKITVDGKAGEGTIRLLNVTDKEKFVRIAITMDRYKLLPEKMPSRFIWVNLPAYYMELNDNDTTRMTSKVICGKPLTRTPVLTSSIYEMVTFPQWTIPNSIIVKEILPAVKKNPGYLAKKGFSLVNNDGEEVDPFSVDWAKYNKGIPYRVVQGSGDDNALGIMKFNFGNKYAVYLHDTNHRYLFSRDMRSLSHGCVRVQDWEKLAYSIIRYDNKKYEQLEKKSPAEDSMITWLGRKEKHSISVKNRLPVYIRYFTCEGKDGRVVFYDDIYGEDRALQAKFFASK